MTSVFKYLYDTGTFFIMGTPPPATWDGPSVNDVMDVKGYMFQKFNLPIEIIDTIIDTAEYWPHTTTITNNSTIIKAQRDRENQFILRSYPLGFVPADIEPDQTGQMFPEWTGKYKTLEPHPWPEDRLYPIDATDEVLKAWESKSKPRGEHPCRKIVFTIKSKDQGWGGGAHDQDNPYKASFTWFDYGLERVSAFTEWKLLEAWEIAPRPQFRLDFDTEEPQESTSKLPNAPKPALVCSLRTVVPETIAYQGRDPYEVHDLHPPPPRRTRELVPPPDSPEEPEEPEEPEGEPETKYRFDHELNPNASALQKNLTANRNIKEHTITWSCDDNINPESAAAMALEKIGRGRNTGSGELVRNLKVGDVVTVWAKARYAGWTNHVEEVKIDVYWAV